MRRKPGGLVATERELLEMLRHGPLHAYAMGRRGTQTGAYSKALRRLEAMGLVVSEWESPPPGRPARRLYRLSPEARE